MIRWLILMLLAAVAIVANGRPAPAANCVQVYYDHVPARPDYTHGRLHAIFLLNLLGHFPRWQRHLIPIERYEKGQLQRCRASFYLGTYYNNPVPSAFIDDFVVSKQRVVWLGYNVWNLGEVALDQLWGMKFKGLSPLDRHHLDARKRPAFFKYFDYRGETFWKYGEFDARVPSRFNAAHEITLLEPLEPEAEEYVAVWARHSARDVDPSLPERRAPYVLRNANHWYVADSPFAFMHEEDRYLVFADLLFDMLGEKPRYGGRKPALVRLEDVHAQLPLWQVNRFSRALEREGIPYSIAIVPIYADPFMVEVERPADKLVPITKRPLFLEYLRHRTAAGVTYIYHGVSHQYGNQKNPFTGLTGDDFEFWDMVHHRPVDKDSPRWVIERLEDGMGLLARAGVNVSAWMTPHYQASALDYVLFGQAFTWSVGRFIYLPARATQRRRLPPELAFDRAGALGNGRRLAYVEDLRVDTTGLPGGQFYPYETYGDVYGQRIVPENVGNIQPFMNEQVYKTQTVDGLIRVARKVRSLRDQWGSFFLHPFLLHDSSAEGVGRFTGDTAEIERLIGEVKRAGYEFVDLKTWIARTGGETAPAPIVTSIDK